MVRVRTKFRREDMSQAKETNLVREGRRRHQFSMRKKFLVGFRVSEDVDRECNLQDQKRQGISTVESHGYNKTRARGKITIH